MTLRFIYGKIGVQKERETERRLNRRTPLNKLSNFDKPYEKFVRLGVSALSDYELLAIILRTGTKGKTALDTAKAILADKKYSGGINSLYHMDIEELKAIPGIGRVKAIQLKCVCEISKRISRSVAERALNFNDPASIAGYYMEALRHEEQENVCCMMLNSKNVLIDELCIFKGTVNASLISPRELYINALARRAVSIVLVHNHPSGDPTPSEDDIYVTKRVYEAGKIIGISLLDHIVIGDNAYVSIMSRFKIEDIV